MGIIIAKFRKKKTTYEVLEKLENEIKSIEEFRRSTEQRQKKMVGRFIFISICIYAISALVFYFYFFPASNYERLLYITPLILLPIIFIFIKKILTWYYNRKIRKNEKTLSVLKEEKKKVLDDVKDKETYKVAKEILEKFAPDQNNRSAVVLAESTPYRGQLPVASNSLLSTQSGLRYRASLNRQFFKPSMESSTPQTSTSTLMKRSTQSLVPSTAAARQISISGTPLLMPRDILPRNRSVLDKMVDYLVGDGPSNRYALICKNCSSHNGMALKEEFDYLSFRCCYCTTFNPARKMRPVAPKLETPLIKTHRRHNESDFENNSESESDDEGAINTEPSDDIASSNDNNEDNTKLLGTESKQLVESEISDAPTLPATTASTTSATTDDIHQTMPTSVEPTIKD